MTERGWVPERTATGDKVHVLDRKGGFGTEGSLDLGRVLGWLAGDGVVKADRAVLSFWGDERELSPEFRRSVDAVVRQPGLNRAYATGTVAVAERNETREQSSCLRDIAEEYGLVDERLMVPEAVLRGCEEMQRGFLQALFTVDGAVFHQAPSTRNVRLTSVSFDLLQDVQRMLANFGIFSRIYQDRKRGKKAALLPEGEGGMKAYPARPQHDLCIGGQSFARFAGEVSSSVPGKRRLCGRLARATHTVLSRQVRGSG